MPTVQIPVTQPDTVQPHPVSLSTEWDKWLPSGTTDWSIFQQTVNVVNAMTTDVEELNHILKLYDWWSIWNQLVFRSSLKPIFVSLETADYGKWLGQCHMSPARKIAISTAAYSHRHREQDDSGHHSSTITNRPAQFESLSGCEWNACLILLHEMMHDCLWSSVGKHSHESESWAALCNMIGRDVLGMPLFYSALTTRKLNLKDAEGNNILQPSKTNPDKLVPKRYTIWGPSIKAKDVPSGYRLAEVDEMRSFPYVSDDPFLEMHTSVIRTGKSVEKNGGQPVRVPPQF